MSSDATSSMSGVASRSSTRDHGAMLGAIHRSDQGQLTSVLRSEDCTAVERGLCLRQACAAGETECARLLLAAHAAVDSADDEGHTSLHNACQFGHGACARLLLTAHAAVDFANHNGATPSL